VGIGNLPALAPEYGHLGNGGAEVQQSVLAKALAARDFKVSMVVADHGQPDGAVWGGVTTYRAYRLNAGLPGLRFFHPRWSSVWAALRRADADIYYVGCAGVLIWQVSLFTRMFGRKVVFGTMSDSDCDPNALLVKLWRDKKLYAQGLRRADLVLTQSALQQQMLRRNYRRDSKVVPAIGGMIGRRLTREQRDIDALWVANLRPLKRPEMFIELARELPHLRFHMIGGAWDGLVDYFNSVREKAAACPNIHFHGSVSYHEVNSYFERTRVFVNTSEIEGFPNTYLQAWGHGVPVVTFLDPDNLIAQNSIGRAVANLEELRTAVDAFTDDSDEWQRASTRSIDFMDRDYNPHTAVNAYVEAFTTLGIQGALESAMPLNASRK
jgi:glycosyltransferase involved in cell wall biosynthesis